jgi:ankyrin repeat protein
MHLLTGKLVMLDRCAADGASPLFLAAQEGHIECVQLLLDNGADANLPTRTPVALPLHAALQFNRIELVSTVTVLLLTHSL